MFNKRWFAIVPMFLIALNFLACGPADSGSSPLEDGVKITLPEPRYDSDISVEEAILQRR